MIITFTKLKCQHHAIISIGVSKAIALYTIENIDNCFPIIKVFASVLQYDKFEYFEPGQIQWKRIFI